LLPEGPHPAFGKTTLPGKQVGEGVSPTLDVLCTLNRTNRSSSRTRRLESIVDDFQTDLTFGAVGRRLLFRASPFFRIQFLRIFPPRCRPDLYGAVHDHPIDDGRTGCRSEMQNKPRLPAPCRLRARRACSRITEDSICGVSDDGSCARWPGRRRNRAAAIAADGP
jgi:hypothetical protein